MLKPSHRNLEACRTGMPENHTDMVVCSDESRNPSSNRLPPLSYPLVVVHTQF